MCGKQGHIAKNCWHVEKPTGSVSVNQSINRGLAIPQRSNNTNNNNRTANTNVEGGQRGPIGVFAMSGAETTTEDKFRGKNKA